MLSSTLTSLRVRANQQMRYNPPTGTSKLFVYTRNIENQTLQHQSSVIISDDLNHNASTVMTFVRQIIKEIILVDPQKEYLHFWTDSPTSQYRNRTIFNFITNLEA